jgi:hypothetical protein
MFQHDMAEKLTNRVEVEDFDSAVIHTSMAFMYTGFLDENPRQDYHHLVDVARFGDKYAVESLVNACFEELYLETNMVNVVAILALVDGANFAKKELRQNLIRYVAM